MDTFTPTPHPTLSYEVAGPEPRTGLFIITPEIAALWLERNKENRSRRTRYADSLADDIRNGEWEVNGETIKFDWNGYCLDGQHRLTACVESGKPIVSYVVTGLDPKSRPTVDIGEKRSPADFLQADGHINTKLLQATAGYEIQYRTGSVSTVKRKPKEVQRLVDENPDLVETVNDIAQRYWRNGSAVVPQSLIAWLYWHAKKQDPELADKFVDGVMYGESLYRGNPIQAYREKMLRLKMMRRTLNPIERLAYGILAWTKFRDGVHTERLMWGRRTKGRRARAELPSIEKK